MIQISNKDFATIIDKLPLILDVARVDNSDLRRSNAKRLLTQLYKKLKRKHYD